MQAHRSYRTICLLSGILGFAGILFASCIIISCSSGQAPAVTRSADDTGDPAEAIRRRNMELLGSDLSEDGIKKDLLGKVIQAYGPEEGAGRQVPAAWTVEPGEIREFAVQRVDAAETTKDVIVRVVFDSSPKKTHRMEGEIRITYAKEAEAWKFLRVRRAGDDLKYQK